MTRRGWGPGWRQNAAGRMEMRAPTQDELLDELLDTDLELTSWRWAHPRAMPPRLWHKLQRLIGSQLRQCSWSRNRIELAHWRIVDKAKGKGMPLKGALHYAEGFVRGTPFEAGQETIRQNYYKAKRRLGV